MTNAPMLVVTRTAVMGGIAAAGVAGADCPSAPHAPEVAPSEATSMTAASVAFRALRRPLAAREGREKAVPMTDCIDFPLVGPAERAARILAFCRLAGR